MAEEREHAQELGWQVWTVMLRAVGHYGIPVETGEKRYYLRSPGKIPFTDGQPVLGTWDGEVLVTQVVLRETEGQAWEDLPDDWILWGSERTHG